MPKVLPPIEQILTLLRTGPVRLQELTRGVEPAVLRSRPAAQEWSANEVLAHLRACADVWGGCIARIVVEDRPTIRAVNPRTWIDQTDYRDRPFAQSLNAFSLQRNELVDLLVELTPEAWTRSAHVIGAGRALERSVHGYAAWLATHERPHIKQVDRAIADLSGR